MKAALSKFWRWLTGPWCEKHPTFRVNEFGCESCFLDQLLQHASEKQAERLRHAREIAKAVVEAMSETGGKA